MSAPAPSALLASGELEREVLARLARGGLSVWDTELRHQLRRRGHPLEALPGVLADLQRRGLIEAEMHYRLTPAGAELVPAAMRPAPIAISSAPWSNPPLSPPTRRRRARPAARAVARTRAARKPATAFRPARDTERLVT